MVLATFEIGFKPLQGHEWTLSRDKAGAITLNLRQKVAVELAGKRAGTEVVTVAFEVLDAANVSLAEVMQAAEEARSNALSDCRHIICEQEGLS